MNSSQHPEAMMMAQMGGCGMLPGLMMPGLGGEGHEAFLLQVLSMEQVRGSCENCYIDRFR